MFALDGGRLGTLHPGWQGDPRARARHPWRFRAPVGQRRAARVAEAVAVQEEVRRQHAARRSFCGSAEHPIAPRCTA